MMYLHQTENIFDVNKSNIPLYKCIKEVNALKIVEMSFDRFNDKVIYKFENYKNLYSNYSFYEKFKPKEGGYLVFYKDNYISYSPKEPFEEGYIIK